MVTHQPTFIDEQYGFLSPPPNVVFALDFTEELASCTFKKLIKEATGRILVLQATQCTVVIEEMECFIGYSLTMPHPLL